MKSLDLIIESSLHNDIKRTKILLPEFSSTTTGAFDHAKLYGTDIGWTITDGKAWKDTAVTAALQRLGAQPFATSNTSTNTLMFQTDILNFQKGLYKGKTGIGYQVLLYNTEIGTNAYFYENGTMEIAGWANHIWGYKLKNGKIYITYKPGAARKTDSIADMEEGYLDRKGGRTIFVDTAEPSKASVQKGKDQELVDYIKKNSLYYGGLSIEQARSKWTRFLDTFQTTLDFVGIIAPPVDLANAIVYAIRGRYLEALISIIALIPIVGDTIAIVFKAIYRAGISVLKLSSKLILRLCKIFEKRLIKKGAKKAGQAATDLVEKNVKDGLSKARIIITKLRKNKLITQGIFDEWISVVDEFEAGMQLAIKERRKWLLQKTLEKRALVAQRLGLNSAAEKTASKFSETIVKLFNELPLKIGKFVKNILVGATRKSAIELVALYKSMLKLFAKQIGTDPKVLALTWSSFADKEVIQEIFKTIYAKHPGTFDTLVKIKPEFFTFTETTTAGFKSVTTTTITGINPKYIYTVASGLFQDPIVYKDLADIVYTRVKQSAGKDGINYYWDVFKTNPIITFITENTNIASRIKELIPQSFNIKSFGLNFSDFITSSRLWKWADVVYNEIVSDKEIRNGHPEITHMGVFTWMMEKLGVYDVAKAAREKIEAQPIMQRILSAPDAKPYGVPGSTDSTTFQFWDSGTIPKSKSDKYTAAYKKSVAKTKKIQK